jgi:hypothetical protein
VAMQVAAFPKNGAVLRVRPGRIVKPVGCAETGLSCNVDHMDLST